MGGAWYSAGKPLRSTVRIFGQTVDESTAITSFTRHVYIIERFKPKMCIKNDILNPEMMVPDVGKNKLTIKNCKNMKVKFNVKNIDPPIKRVVRFNGIIKVPTSRGRKDMGWDGMGWDGTGS